MLDLGDLAPPGGSRQWTDQAVRRIVQRMGMTRSDAGLGSTAASIAETIQTIAGYLPGLAEGDPTGPEILATLRTIVDRLES